MSDQLHVELEPQQLRVQPGSPAGSQVRVVNLGEVVEEYELSLVGLPPGVGRVEPARLSLLPEQEGQAQVVFDADGAADVPAGGHVVGVRVASRSRAHVSYVAELSLQIAAVDALSLEVAPQTVRGGGGGELRAAVVNGGNRPVDVALQGTDDEGAVTFSFEPQRLRVPPGGRGTSRVTVDAPRSVTGAERHRQLRITAGDTAANATFVQRALLPTGLLMAAGMVVSLLLVGAVALCADGECLGTPVAMVEQAGSLQDGGEDATPEEPEEDVATEEPSEESEPPSPEPATDPPSPEPEPVFAQVEQCTASAGAAPVPADADRVEETIGDLDGDELPDRVTTYMLRNEEGGSVFYLRVETAIGFVGTAVLDQASGLGNVRPLGTHQIGDAPEVAFVQEESGASTILLSLWGLHADEAAGGCELRRITLPDPTAGLLFPVGGGVSFGSGLECRDADDDGNPDLWVWEAQAFESEGYVGRGIAWSWSGAGALTLVDFTSQDPEPLGDELVERAFGLDCPGVRQ